MNAHFLIFDRLPFRFGFAVIRSVEPAKIATLSGENERSFHSASHAFGIRKFLAAIAAIVVSFPSESVEQSVEFGFAKAGTHSIPATLDA
jgi:hypothetical protein